MIRNTNTLGNLIGTFRKVDNSSEEEAVQMLELLSEKVKTADQAS